MGHEYVLSFPCVYFQRNVLIVIKESECVINDIFAFAQYVMNSIDQGLMCLVPPEFP